MSKMVQSRVDIQILEVRTRFFRNTRKITIKRACCDVGDLPNFSDIAGPVMQGENTARLETRNLLYALSHYPPRRLELVFCSS